MKGVWDLKTVAYYISEYGFGHATRSIAVIRELLTQREDIRVVVCNQYGMGLLQDALQDYGERVTFHETKVDIGYILKENTLELDPVAMNKAYEAYREQFPQFIQEECRYFAENPPALILSDISPLAFGVGQALGVPAIGISNFTWASACNQVLKQDLLDWLCEQYEKASTFIRLAGYTEERYADGEDVGYFSRKVNEQEVSRLRTLHHIQPHEKVICMIIGMKIDLDGLQHWEIWNQENCRFVVASNMHVNHPNVITIPRECTESQHYVALSDVVISKAGWGTVGEAVNNGKQLILINRDMTEDQNTIHYLKEHYPIQLVDFEDLQSLHIEQFEQVPPLENDVATIVKKVLQY